LVTPAIGASTTGVSTRRLPRTSAMSPLCEERQTDVDQGRRSSVSIRRNISYLHEAAGSALTQLAGPALAAQHRAAQSPVELDDRGQAEILHVAVRVRATDPHTALSCGGRQSVRAFHALCGCTSPQCLLAPASLMARTLSGPRRDI
jgi:hypothetical protein